jgi:pimeloyl-ACP methyl ester carboxylesterase
MFVKANGIEIHYQETGNGHPLILLHGNAESLEIYDELTEKLKKHFKVYRLDSRDHGQSTKTNTYRYDVMAEDVFGFINALGIVKPHLVGFSDGGIIAMMLEIKHPGLLKSMVLLGSNTRPNGMRYKVVKAMKRKYKETKSPLYLMMITQPFIRKSELRSIQCHTLIVVGEKDLILKKHTHMIHRQIKHSKVVIMKDRRHDDYVTHKDELFQPLMTFFKK